MVAVVDEVTAVVVTVNVAVVPPAETITAAGRTAAALLLDKATEMPPLGAALVKVTVPVEGAPPVTLAGLRDTDESAVDDDAMASVALLLTPLLLAVIVAVAAVVTTVVATVKVAVVLPAATVTIAGTVAAVLLLDS